MHMCVRRLTATLSPSKLNHMVHLERRPLDAVFAALSDPTRRAVVERLGEGGSRTVSELAQPHGMSLTGFMKHLRVLEDAGLVRRMREGRSVRCELSPHPMQEAAVWLSNYEKFWAGRLDALASFLDLQEETAWPDPPTARKKRPVSPSAGTTRSRRAGSGAPGPSRKR